MECDGLPDGVLDCKDDSDDNEGLSDACAEGPPDGWVVGDDDDVRLTGRSVAGLTDG